MSSISGYLDFIVARASGRLHTPARWMRDFVCSHPDYRQDSVVSERIAADLLAKCHRIGLGVEAAPALLGDVVIPEVRAKDAYAAAGMGDSHRLSRISRSTAELMASHQFRYQLQERRTRLQASEADLRKKWEKTRHELEEVEAQIAFLSPK